MATLPFDLEDATLGQGLSLLVVERDGISFEEFEVKIAGDASAYLEESWENTLEIIRNRELVPTRLNR